ncbi:MAG TPA: hypothetical protein VFW19_10975, partial [Allosphingosinicella sp.]|nr:hypothetical protein [Allosphingosinicella sp.]
ARVGSSLVRRGIGKDVSHDQCRSLLVCGPQETGPGSSNRNSLIFSPSARMPPANDQQVDLPS